MEAHHETLKNIYTEMSRNQSPEEKDNLLSSAVYTVSALERRLSCHIGSTNTLPILHTQSAMKFMVRHIEHYLSNDEADPVARLNALSRIARSNLVLENLQHDICENNTKRVLQAIRVAEDAIKQLRNSERWDFRLNLELYRCCFEGYCELKKYDKAARRFCDWVESMQTFPCPKETPDIVLMDEFLTDFGLMQSSRPVKSVMSSRTILNQLLEGCRKLERFAKSSSWLKASIQSIMIRALLQKIYSQDTVQEKIHELGIPRHIREMRDMRDLGRELIAVQQVIPNDRAENMTLWRNVMKIITNIDLSLERVVFRYELKVMKKLYNLVEWCCEQTFSITEPVRGDVVDEIVTQFSPKTFLVTEGDPTAEDLWESLVDEDRILLSQFFKSICLYHVFSSNCRLALSWIAPLEKVWRLAGDEFSPFEFELRIGDYFHIRNMKTEAKQWYKKALSICTTGSQRRLVQLRLGVKVTETAIDCAQGLVKCRIFDWQRIPNPSIVICTRRSSFEDMASAIKEHDSLKPVYDAFKDNASHAGDDGSFFYDTVTAEISSIVSARASLTECQLKAIHAVIDGMYAWDLTGNYVRRLISILTGSGRDFGLSLLNAVMCLRYGSSDEADLAMDVLPETDRRAARMWAQSLRPRNVKRWTSDVRCKCGKLLAVVYAEKAYGGGHGVVCEACEIAFRRGDLVYHCDGGFCPAHPGGFDLCLFDWCVMDSGLTHGQKLVSGPPVESTKSEPPATAIAPPDDDDSSHHSDSSTESEREMPPPATTPVRKELSKNDRRRQALYRKSELDSSSDDDDMKAREVAAPPRFVKKKRRSAPQRDSFNSRPPSTPAKKKKVKFNTVPAISPVAFATEISQSKVTFESDVGQLTATVLAAIDGVSVDGQALPEPYALLKRWFAIENGFTVERIYHEACAWELKHGTQLPCNLVAQIRRIFSNRQPGNLFDMGLLNSERMGAGVEDMPCLSDAEMTE